MSRYNAYIKDIKILTTSASLFALYPYWIEAWSWVTALDAVSEASYAVHATLHAHPDSLKLSNPHHRRDSPEGWATKGLLLDS